MKQWTTYFIGLAIIGLIIGIAVNIIPEYYHRYLTIPFAVYIWGNYIFKGR